MNPPEIENITETAPAEPPKPATQSAPSSRKTLGLAAAAFLMGVVGTAAITANRTAVPAGPPAEAATQTDPALQPSTLLKIEPAAAQNAGIKTQPARLAPLTILMTVPGTVEANPNGQAKITPPVSGKLTRILVSLGNTVRKGQPLAVLDSYDVAQAHAAVRDAELGVGQAASAVQTAQAQTGEARAKLGSAQTALRRQRQLAQAGAFSQAPLLAAQSEASQAQSELTQAQTELRTRTAAAQRAERLIQDQLISKSEMEQMQADQQQAQARAEQAAVRAALAKQTLIRERKVYGGDLLSKQAVQSAQAEVEAARAEVQTSLSQAQAAGTALRSARGRVTAAQDTLAVLENGGHTAGGAGLITLYAPLGGVVTERSATPGETVERSTALMTLSSTNVVLVQANVPEQDAARVQVGQTVQVTVPAYAGQSFAGRVQTLGSRMDEKTRTLPVQCLVENRDGRLRPEMFARVSLSTGKGGRAVFVPSTAIDEDGGQRFVYVATGGGYEKRAVKVGHSTEKTVQIVSGIQPGETVATEGVFVLKSESKKDELKGDD